MKVEVDDVIQNLTQQLANKCLEIAKLEAYVKKLEAEETEPQPQEPKGEIEQ